MKHLRYYAEFYDRSDTKWRVEVLQESDSAYNPVEVELAAEPVTLEWNEVEKLDPVRGCGATLRLISMSDRQFYDMYSVDYGVIELNLYRAGSLFWAGTLDPELFSEPYAYSDRYVTELTFVDFAVGDYAKWDGEGRLTIKEIISKCISALRINADLRLDLHISTTANTMDGPISVEECILDANNFYDEDGEAMTMREVLEETLRPFALQIVQRDGSIHVYDCQYLASMEPLQIDWYSDDATLDVDRAYNNVRVRFSPADISQIVDSTLEPEDFLQGGMGLSRPVQCMVHGETEFTTWFLLHYGGFGTVNDVTVELNAGATFFRVEPIYSGDEDVGILWGASFPDGSPGSDKGRWLPNKPRCVFSDDTVWPSEPCIPIASYKQFFTRGLLESSREQILISLDFLYDQRSNFYEDAGMFSRPDDLTYVNWFEAAVAYVYVPVVITLRSLDGKRLYRYSNNYRRHPFHPGNDSQVGWFLVNDESSIYNYPAWLCYYNDSFNGDTGLQGWQTNKRIVGPSISGAPILTEVQKRRNSGEYINLPPEAGYIKIELCAGTICHTADHTPIYEHHFYTFYAYRFARGWVAYKNLKVRYTPRYGGEDDFSESDFEDSGYINKLAREELEIDTIIGSSGETVMAKGDINDSLGRRITSFTRGGYTDKSERLLIGTAYSQYATRKNVLSGTIVAPARFGVLSDASIDGKYMIVSEVLNVEESTSEIRAIEVSTDNYESIQEVEDNA